MIRDDDRKVLPACFIGASCQNTAHPAKHYQDKGPDTRASLQISRLWRWRLYFFTCLETSLVIPNMLTCFLPKTAFQALVGITFGEMVSAANLIQRFALRNWPVAEGYFLACLDKNMLLRSSRGRRMHKQNPQAPLGV
jgi:hypothetical protein